MDNIGEAGLVSRLAYNALNRFASDIVELVAAWYRLVHGGTSSDRVDFVEKVKEQIPQFQLTARQITTDAYRLRRALILGETTTDPFTRGGDTPEVSLNELRRNFGELVGAVDSSFATQYEDSHGWGGDEVIPVVDIFGDDLPDLPDAGKQMDDALDEIAGWKDPLDDFIEEDKAISDKLREEAEKKRRKSAEKVVGGAVQKVVRDSGRGWRFYLLHADPGCSRWIRVSYDGCCPWCMVLLSRGAIYKSRRAAVGVEPYHRNCNCEAEEIFDARELDDDRFQNNWDAAEAYKAAQRYESVPSNRKLKLDGVNVMRRYMYSRGVK